MAKTEMSENNSTKNDIIKAGLAGASSIIAATSTHPIDLIKIRM
jgi:hypothetical protein